MKLFASFAALLVGIFQMSGLAQLVQPPTCSFVFQNPTGYQLDDYDPVQSLDRTKTTAFSLGIIIKFRATTEGNPDKAVFVWANSLGKILGTYILPDGSNAQIVPNMSDSRVTLYDFSRVTYLNRSTRTNQLTVRVADNVSYFQDMGEVGNSYLDNFLKGFVRLRQDNQLQNTTVEYFAP